MSLFFSFNYFTPLKQKMKFFTNYWQRKLFYIAILISCSLLILSYKRLIYQEGSRDLLDNTYTGDFNVLAKIPDCKTPKVKLWPDDIWKINLNSPPLKCENESSEWFTIKKKKIFFKQSAMSHILKENITCELRVIDVKEHLEVSGHLKDKLYILKTFTNITDGTAIPSDLFSIHCKKNTSTKFIFENVYFTIKTRQKIKRKKIYKNTNKTQYNFLIWCLDGVSKMSWKRFLPKTIKAFEEVGGTWINKYNVVRTGTIGTFVPFLLGRFPEKLHQSFRNKPNATFLDDYPWIWNTLKDQGYATLFTDAGSLNRLFTGFKSPPTHHYGRPFFYATEPMKKNKRDYCLKSKPKLRIVQDYTIEFLKSYPAIPKFAFVNYHEMSHDFFPDVKLADDIQRNWIHNLFHSKLMDNTIFILMSDHGIQLGGATKLTQFEWEFINPFIGIKLPKSFIQSHPQEVINLQANKNSLITPFDIHKTLTDIISFISGGQVNLTTHFGSISLFQKIPKNRSCSEANIYEKFCPCDKFTSIDIKDNLVKLIVQMIQIKITSLMEPIAGKCKNVIIQEINEASRKIKPLKSKLFFEKKVLFRIRFTVSLFHGEFLSYITVNYFEKMPMPKISIEEIIRLDRYGKQPRCIEKQYPDLAKFCYCKNHRN